MHGWRLNNKTIWSLFAVNPIELMPSDLVSKWPCCWLIRSFVCTVAKDFGGAAGLSLNLVSESPRLLRLSDLCADGFPQAVIRQQSEIVYDRLSENLFLPRYICMLRRADGVAWG